MATLTKQGQVQYQGGEMLPAVGTDAYNQSLSGIIPNVPAKMSASDLGNGSTAYTPPVNNKSAQTGLSVANTALAENITSSQEQAQAEQTAPKNDRSGILASIKAGIDQLRGKGDRTAELNQEEGTFQKKQLATKLEGDYISKQRAYDKQIEKIRENKGGMLDSAVEAEVANVERQKNSELADISIQYKIANGAYTDAVSIVDAKVNAEFEPIENEIKAYENLYQLYGDDLTESEKTQVEANIQAKRDDLDYQRQIARDKTLHQYQLSEIAAREAANASSNTGDEDVNAYVIAYQSGQIPLTQVPQKIRGQVLAAAQSTGNNRLLGLVGQYKDTLSGLNILTANAPKNKAILNSLKGQITAEYKQQKQLGTLDAGVQKLIDTIIPDPSKLSITSLSNKAQVAAIDNFIKNQGGSKPVTPTKEDPLGLGI
jgi:hypothetical protein